MLQLGIVSIAAKVRSKFPLSISFCRPDLCSPSLQMAIGRKTVLPVAQAVVLDPVERTVTEEEVNPELASSATKVRFLRPVYRQRSQFIAEATSFPADQRVTGARIVHKRIQARGAQPGVADREAAATTLVSRCVFILPPGLICSRAHVACSRQIRTVRRT